MRLEQVRAALQGVKGNGAWRTIARRSGIHYDTLARIARGAIPDPGARTVEAISDALDAMAAEAAPPKPRDTLPEGA